MHSNTDFAESKMLYDIQVGCQGFMFFCCVLFFKMEEACMWLIFIEMSECGSNFFSRNRKDAINEQKEVMIPDVVGIKMCKSNSLHL